MVFRLRTKRVFSHSDLCEVFELLHIPNRLTFGKVGHLFGTFNFTYGAFSTTGDPAESGDSGDSGESGDSGGPDESGDYGESGESSESVDPGDPGEHGDAGGHCKCDIYYPCTPYFFFC